MIFGNDIVCDWVGDGVGNGCLGGVEYLVNLFYVINCYFGDYYGWRFDGEIWF